ncbi:MAG: AAA family ATPase [Coriobacteriia bacterium]
MEETPERLDRVSRLEELGPEVEALFAKGLAQVPLVICDRVDSVVRYLRAGRNVALVGRSGSGKRSIAYSLRRSDVWGEDPQLTLALPEGGAHANSWPVYRTGVRHWMDGALYVGNLEQKVTLVCRRVKRDSIVLFESIHQAIGAWQGRNKSLDLVDLLVDVADHPLIHMVVTTTPEGWVRLKESKPDFADRFVVVEVAPLDDIESRMVTTFGLSDGDYAGDAIDEAFRLARRHFDTEAPLGPVMRLLRGAHASASGQVEREGVRKTCAAELGIDRRWIGADCVPSSQEILSQIEAAVVGQSVACAAVADDLVAMALGLSAPGRPLSYVLAGTPGVGKTTLACAVQEVLAGQGVHPWRIDCSEYSTPFDVQRLLSQGADSLITGLMRRPGTVVLLDEVDRLHPSGRDLLYQVLEGRLTSMQGETVSCANAVIFMTTNIGSAPWLRSSLDSAAADRAQAMTRQHCVEMLGPAIASRVGRILVFPPLDESEAAVITRVELGKAAKLPGLVDRGVELDVSDGLVTALARVGRSATNGVRGLQKMVHEVVVIPVARYLHEHPDASGHLRLDAIEVGGALEGVRVRQCSVTAGSLASAAPASRSPLLDARTPTPESSRWN